MNAATMTDTDTTRLIVARLHALGLPLAVDDFGTGYSSLLYLRRFPVHALKLDRSFVAGIGTSEVDTAIVASMTSSAVALVITACSFLASSGVRGASAVAFGATWAERGAQTADRPTQQASRKVFMGWGRVVPLVAHVNGALARPGICNKDVNTDNL